MCVSGLGQGSEAGSGQSTGGGKKSVIEWGLVTLVTAHSAVRCAMEDSSQTPHDIFSKMWTPSLKGHFRFTLSRIQLSVASYSEVTGLRTEAAK